MLLKTPISSSSLPVVCFLVTPLVCHSFSCFLSLADPWMRIYIFSKNLYYEQFTTTSVRASDSTYLPYLNIKFSINGISCFLIHTLASTVDLFLYFDLPVIVKLSNAQWRANMIWNYLDKAVWNCHFIEMLYKRNISGLTSSFLSFHSKHFQSLVRGSKTQWSEFAQSRNYIPLVVIEMTLGVM